LILGQHISVQVFDGILIWVLGNVCQPSVVPSEIVFPTRVRCCHNISSVSSEIKERMLVNLATVIASRILYDCILYCLVLLVL